MRVASLGVARPAYYDRNATSVTASVAGQYYTPHAATTRSTTTVASGKKVLVESIYLFQQRTVAATTLGVAGFYIAFDGGVLATVNLNNNTVGSTSSQTLFGACTAYAGSAVTLVTYDFSTGGTVYYDGNWRGTQFDA